MKNCWKSSPKQRTQRGRWLVRTRHRSMCSSPGIFCQSSCWMQDVSHRSRSVEPIGFLHSPVSYLPECSKFYLCTNSEKVNSAQFRELNRIGFTEWDLYFDVLNNSACCWNNDVPSLGWIHEGRTPCTELACGYTLDACMFVFVGQFQMVSTSSSGLWLMCNLHACHVCVKCLTPRPVSLVTCMHMVLLWFAGCLSAVSLLVS